MIKGVFIINTAGKMRLFKFYGIQVPTKARKHLINLLGEIIIRRTAKNAKCNFVDKNELYNLAIRHTKTYPFSNDERCLNSFYNLLNKSCLVYRTYASLHFLVLTDEGENLLGILCIIRFVFVIVCIYLFLYIAIMDLIHLYVQLLERKYINVCEYDIVFEPQSAYYVLEELIIDGLVSDINLDTLTKEMFEIEKYETISDERKLKKIVLKPL